MEIDFGNVKESMHSSGEVEKHSGTFGYPEGPICGRCYNAVELFDAPCNEKPETLKGQPIGQYHCPDCGAMVLAGLPHPQLCQLCRDLEHPGFDKPKSYPVKLISKSCLRNGGCGHRKRQPERCDLTGRLIEEYDPEDQCVNHTEVTGV
ncbi:MAG: hypothetical protein KAS32_10130 [Candidatus Peribacteraceae bacterium]|nr:hypothetical protein [Candidatus Peribacteraceae bacterium]